MEEHVSRRKSQRSGAAVVELAFCLPVLLIIVFGTIEICHCTYRKQSIKIAAYEGARVALIPGATETKVRDQVNLILQDRRITGGVVNVAPRDFDAQPTGTFVAVEVSAPHAENNLMAKTFYAQEFITARVEMMREFDGSSSAP